MYKGLISFNKQENKNKLNIKQKEEKIVHSLFEVEKFLYCYKRANEYGKVVKFLKQNFCLK